MIIDSPAGIALLVWALVVMLGGTLYVIWPRSHRSRRRLTGRRRKG